ncbi:hypothetical protein [Micromonospora sp. 4G55]|nr:hypothetical protein [Micromonospora sp. 4G55]MBM0257253.1 hypothetical protein [Micromonospora sp. 4G55]
MPATRFGYLLYPLALLVWAPRAGRTAGHRFAGVADTGPPQGVDLRT